MIAPIKQRYVVAVDEHEAVPTADGHGMTSQKTGRSAWEVDVTVDLAGIVRVLGKRAVGNKTGVAKCGFVKVVRRRRLPDAGK